MDKLKMLLGIANNEQDKLLQFLLDEVRDMICGYCRIDEIPTKLESLVPVIAADLYRRKGYGEAEAPQEISTITEDKRSVSFHKQETETDFLKNYYVDEKNLLQGLDREEFEAEWFKSPTWEVAVSGS